MNTRAAQMPARDASRIRRAVAAFRSQELPQELAAVVQGAHRAGWSYRTIARSLGLSRERTMQLAAVPATPFDHVSPYCPGTAFPDSVVQEFQQRHTRAARRRELAKAKAAATIRAAHEAGWPYPALAALVGISDEWIRKMALHSPAAEAAAPFDPPAFLKADGDHAPAPPVELSPDLSTRMEELSSAARSSTKNTGRTLGPAPTPEELAALQAALAARKASEELSGLIIAAKQAGVPWSVIDAACGYRPGSARARALRHGYGTLPPSRTAYQRTPAS